jgi:CubicO group peptidase (beta-lactamase class C family)
MIPLPNPNTLFWGGYGGSLIVIDMDAHTTFAYAMNKMGAGTVGDNRAFSIISAMWQALAA